MEKVWNGIDTGIEKLKGQLSQERLDVLVDKLSSLGARLGVPMAITVILIAGVTQTVQSDDDYMEGALKASGLVFVFGYLSHRFAEGCRKAASGARSTLSLAVYLDVMVVIGFLGAVACVLLALQQLFKGDFNDFAGFLAMGFVSLVITWTLSNPRDLGVYVDEASDAASDYLTLILVTVRVSLRTVVPLAAALIVICSVMVLINLVGYVSADEHETYGYVSKIRSNTELIVSAVAAPVSTYLMYVVVVFFIALFESILRLKWLVPSPEEEEVSSEPEVSTPSSTSSDSSPSISTDSPSSTSSD